MKLLDWLLIVILLLASGCTQSPGVDATLPAQPQLTATDTPSPTWSPPQITPGPVTLRLWVPPEFDPAADTSAGKLLQARLDEFSNRRPDTRVEVRVKPLEGAGSILEALATSSAAAPLALPDLVALRRPDLETAAVKGLLHPLDDLILPLDETDWYEYARQMARLQDSIYGLPFAGDAQMLVYRTATVPEPPRTFSDTFLAPGPLIFTAADPQALFTLAEYRAGGGNILDDQGRPLLQPDPLTQVLTYFQLASVNELMPNWLTQFQEDDQAWESFVEGNGTMIATWMSRYLNNPLTGTSGAPLPTLNGKPLSLASGWVWAIASPDPERQRLSADLAQYLSEGDFLTEWASEAGYLPTRRSAMTNWGTAEQRALAQQIVSAAELMPAVDVLNSLSTPLQTATIQVLKQQKDPYNAAIEAIDSLNTP
jgi:ABC-type glycerol-3-phosphate transport system substrate-binding protein